MALIYSASQLKLLRPGAKRNPLDAYHYDIHPRIHNLDDMLDKIYEELIAIDTRITTIDSDIDGLETRIETLENTNYLNASLVSGTLEKFNTDYELVDKFDITTLKTLYDLDIDEAFVIDLIIGVKVNSSTSIDNNIIIKIARLSATDEELASRIFSPAIPKYTSESGANTRINIKHFFSSTEMLDTKYIAFYTKQLDDGEGKGYLIDTGNTMFFCDKATYNNL
jgi:hypothetical protein